MNNRQAGRRRGRGGQQRSQGGNPNGRDSGNRIDNRARGNAAQLLEKYKNLARDAQMQGDRVNTEYYLQFADHYFRVLSESRSRFEENNQRRQREDEDDDDFEMEGEAGTPDQFQQERRPERAERQDRNERYDRGDRQERGDRPERGERPQRGERQDRGERRDDRRRERPVAPEGNGPVGNDDTRVEQPPLAAEAEAPVEEAPRRRGRPRRQPVESAEGEAPAAIEADRLPPSLGLVSEEAEEAPKPRRRRTRKDEEATPSAA